MINQPTLQDTIDLAKHAHGKHNATDKGGKVPYYWHLLRVMLRLQTDDAELLQIAILHDIVEDTHITLKDLEKLGYSNRVIEGVRWSSKNMFEGTFAQWMRAIGQHAPDDTILLKIADISDNLGFERMRGLMGRNTSILKNNSHTFYIEPDLKKRVDRLVDKKMRLSGEMGVFDRYYKGWNLMFENSSRLHLIDKVYIGDFCQLNQLQSLSNYLPQNEFSQYIEFNKINTWKITGELDIVSDKAGNGYVALKINPEDTSPYINFIEQHISKEFIQNQKTRDKNHHHITIIPVMQVGQLRKNNPIALKNFLDQYLHQNFDVFTYGIGTVTKENNKQNSQAWFTICENALLKTEREKLLLPKQDFHITLAFDNTDVFGVSKDKTSVIYSNKELWEDFTKQFYKKFKKTNNIK